MTFLSKSIGFVGAWFCWGVGHVCYWILSANDSNEGWCEYWYEPYNNWMIASSQVQDWAGGAGSYWPWDGVQS